MSTLTFDIKNHLHLEFPSLFKGIFIGNKWIKNRICLAPINTGFAYNNSVSKRLIQFHNRIAIGGVGLNIVGSTAISLDGIVNKSTLCIENDERIHGFKSLVEVIKDNGSVSALQLNHSGGNQDNELSYLKSFAPSSIKIYDNEKIPKSLSKKEIHRLIIHYGNAAFRAIKSGFEIIEIHCAHGYLINQFLSPITNKRKDEYGGNLFNRCKFAFEVIQSIKERIGHEIPIICRISAEEKINGGLSILEMKKVAKWFYEIGVNALDISAGVLGVDIVPNINLGPSVFASYASEIKQVVRIPIIIAGNIFNLNIADELIKNKKADIVALGRPLIADPMMVIKIMNNKKLEVSKCTYCSQCNYRRHGLDHISCPQNKNL